jgi:hypothetical protein
LFRHALLPLAPVVGTFEGVGGLRPGPPFTYSSGTVTLSGSTGTFKVRISTNGSFTIQLPPGTYQVRGRTPSFDSGKTPCWGPDVTVHSGATAHTKVTCQLK